MNKVSDIYEYIKSKKMYGLKTAAILPYENW